MKTIFLTMMIAMMFWNGNVGEDSGSDSTDFRFTFFGKKYTVEESGLAPDTKVKEIRGQYINGYQITPKEVKHKGTVVVFGGGNGILDFPSACDLANQGYEVYCMYFFGQENQQREFSQIPLEFFAELCLHIKKSAQSPRPLTLHGISGGAELSLLLASYYPDQVDHLILYAPSAFVFEGLNEKMRGSGHSAFTYGGKELPYITIESEEIRTKQFVALRNKKRWQEADYYRYGLEYAGNKENARIDLTPVRAKMLLFAGELDAVWPAAEMSRELKKHYKGSCDVFIYEKAGHSFLADAHDVFTAGGEPEANLQAKIESDRIRLEKLAEWTK